MFLKLVIFTTLVVTSLQLSTPNDPVYVAGVVEAGAESLFNILELNATKYTAILDNALKNNADILVFPEDVISSDANAIMYIPEAAQNTTPCDDFSPIDFDGALLRAFSCAARQAKLYLVLNLREKIKCVTMCAVTGPFIYHSTNVVFNRNGTVISKYRANTTNTFEIGIFTTDFGVTFGHVTGMDLLSKYPITAILAKGITDIICPMSWKSELPFLTALQVQQNWAYRYNVNLLVAGLNSPTRGLSGTGIYAGRFGPLVSAINEEGLQTYFENVAKKNFPLENSCKMYMFESMSNQQNMAMFAVGQENLKQYQTKEINFNVTRNQSSTIFKDRVCHNGVCCDIWMRVRNPEASLYKYRMVAFDGVRSFEGNVTKGVTVCGIVACANHLLESCGTRNLTVKSQNMTFEQIFITGRFDGLDDMMTIPNSVNFNLLPLDSNDFNYLETYDYEDDKKWWKNITYELVYPRSDLLTFAIYGRNFRKDGWIATGTGSGNLLEFKISVLVVSVVFMFIGKMFEM